MTVRNYGLMLSRMGKLEDALRVLDGALKWARSTGNHTVLAYVLATFGSAYTDLSRWAEADAVLREAASLTTDGVGSDRSLRAQVESFRARLDLARGNLTAAHQHSDLSLQSAGYRTATPDRMLKMALLTAAQIALAQHVPAQAEQFSRDALALCDSIAHDPYSSADVGEALLRVAQTHALAGAHR
jgi:tetratricopeptide (TPR) repeat protein